MNVVADVGETLTRARELASAGEFLEALELYRSLETPPDPAVAVEEVQLRHRAFGPLRRQTGNDSRPWPPDVPDLFPEGGQPPEIAFADLTPQLVASAIRHHGCLLVRGILGPDEANALHPAIDRAFEAFGRTNGDPSRDAEPPWYVPLELDEGYEVTPLATAFLWSASGLYAGVSPPALIQYLRALERAGFLDIVERHLGEPPALSLNKTVLRRNEGGAEPTWHQDGIYLGTERPAVNLWLSLSSCGGDSDTMGLNILPRRVDHLLPGGTHDAIDHRAIADAVVQEEAARAPAAPVTTPYFEPGDGLVFDQVFVHRSEARKLPGRRYAIESWFFAPSGFPDGLVPLVAR